MSDLDNEPGRPCSCDFCTQVASAWWGGSLDQLITDTRRNAHIPPRPTVPILPWAADTYRRLLGLGRTA